MNDDMFIFGMDIDTTIILWIRTNCTFSLKKWCQKVSEGYK